MLSEFDRNSSGFVRVQTLASAHVLHLPINSVQIFQVGSDFGLRVKSETIFFRGKCKKMIKLEVQPLESAFRVTVGAVKMRFSSITYAGWYKSYKSIFKMGHNTHEQTTYILMPRVRDDGNARAKNRECVQE